MGGKIGHRASVRRDARTGIDGAQIGKQGARLREGSGRRRIQQCERRGIGDPPGR